jgi:hypothetical protein
LERTKRDTFSRRAFESDPGRRGERGAERPGGGVARARRVEAWSSMMRLA